MTKQCHRENKCARGWGDYLKLDIHGKCVCDARLDGKFVIVTGANTGIGFETCRALADRGAKVLMACRSKEKGERALNELKKENPQRDIGLELVDVSNMKSVKTFAEIVNEKYDKVDILINNAGAVMNCGVTEEGFENSFATNHLGHFLLTNLLMEKLIKAPAARIINVSSEAHRLGAMNLGKLQMPKSSGSMAYCDSKLHNILFTVELAHRLHSTTVSAFALHPGVVKTNFASNFSIKSPIDAKTLFQAITGPISKTAAQGAQTTIHLSLSEDVVKHSGGYFDNCALSKATANATNILDAMEFWNVCEGLLGLSSEHYHLAKKHNLRFPELYTNGNQHKRIAQKK